MTMHAYRHRIENIRVSAAFALLVFVHFMLSAVDRFAQVALDISIYLIVSAMLIRWFTAAKRLGDLLCWARASRVAAWVWLLGTVSLCAQTLWFVADGYVDMRTWGMVTIFAAFFLGVFVTAGAWIWRKIAGLFSSGRAMEDR